MEQPDLSTVAGRVAHLRALTAGPGERPLSARSFATLARLRAPHVSMIESGKRTRIETETARALASACVTSSGAKDRAIAVSNVTGWILFGEASGFYCAPDPAVVREGIAAAKARAAKRGDRIGRTA